MSQTDDYVMKVYTTEKEAIKGDKTTLLASISSNTITASAPHGLEPGDIIYFKTTGQIGNINTNAEKGRAYHVRTVGSDTTFTFSVAKNGHEYVLDNTTLTSNASYVIRSNSLQVGVSANTVTGSGYNQNMICTEGQWSYARSDASAPGLNEALDIIETAITVDEEDDFSVNDVIRINQEEMSVSAVTSDNSHVLTVTRGVNDTPRQAHADNSVIYTVNSSLQKQSHIIDNNDRTPRKISNSGYWTNVKYYYRIETNEPAKKIYVDWDDGEDNDPNSKANYSLKEFDTPQDYAVFEHIYTKHGAFFPKIKVTSVEGFESKYYTPSWGAVAASPLANKQVITITTVADNADSLDDTWFRIWDGNNQGYHVWINTDSTDDQKHTVTIPPELIEVHITTKGTNLGTGVVTGDGSDAALVATALDNALGTNNATCLQEVIGAWTETRSSSVLTLTNTIAGNSNYPDAGTSGFTMAVTTYGAENDVSSLENDPQAALETGRIVQVDSVTAPRIPTLCPSHSPSVGVLKLDKTQVYAGIDNEPLQGMTNPNVFFYLDGKDMDGRDATDPTINGSTRRQAEATIDNILDVVWVSTKNQIYKDTVGANTQSSNSASYSVGSSTIFVKKILSVKLRDIREGGDNYQGASAVANLYPNEKIHLIGYTRTGSPGAPDVPTSSSIASGTDPTICSISLGNPYASVKDSLSLVTLDGSDSYTRESNVSIKKYVFDTGRHSEGVSGTMATGASGTGPSYTMFRGGANPYFPERLPASTQTSFCFDVGKGEQLDNNHRFYDKEQLIRVQVMDSAFDTRMSDEDYYNISPIEVDTTTQNYYIGDGRSLFYPTFAKPQGVLLYYASDSDGSETATWTDLSVRNLTNTTEVIGGAVDTAYRLGTSVSPALDAATDAPTNFLLIVKDKKFNKIHFNLDNDVPPDLVRQLAEKSGTLYDDGSADANACALTVWYSTRDGWVPIDFTDTTAALRNNPEPTSLMTSGSITFDMPVDWESLSQQDVGAGGVVEAAPVDHDLGTSATTDPIDMWDFNGYGVLVGFSVTAEPTAIKVVRAHVCNNSHSQTLTIKDPMHVSLNEIPITQSLSYGRTGKFHRIENRLGTAEIRKIAATGGDVRFGGVDLSDGYREKLEAYHRDGVPVYLDIMHLGGGTRPHKWTRFYGVITNMSLDHPVGKQFSKFGISLACTHIIEMASDGTWTKRISLGGDIEDEQKYTF